MSVPRLLEETADILIQSRVHPLSKAISRQASDWYAKALAARTKMARLFEKMMRLHLEKVTNASDLGEIVSLGNTRFLRDLVDRPLAFLDRSFPSFAQ